MSIVDADDGDGGEGDDGEGEPLLTRDSSACSAADRSRKFSVCWRSRSDRCAAAALASSTTPVRAAVAVAAAAARAVRVVAAGAAGRRFDSCRRLERRLD